MSEQLGKRIRKIEEHVNETLRNDLKKTLEAGDEVYAEISEYLQLRNLIEKMRDFRLHKENMKTMVDVGCNTYVKAVIPSVELILIDIGLGFYLECNHDEALRVIEMRTSFLNDRTAVFKKRANTLKARIKLFIEGLRELQGIPSS
ncbi:hypothetical protein EG68_09867 [Paragonimus skrjabini miyazakii]|uniref:Protein UXT n=1 Tax=Paragonimus skrjabini miyazakii TaxID=59628 RepID=A0A8S9YGZ6_9TREM|nr:hypothetical protein EG68_09867 [Paragonimus skrjabini miyazakii]